jgi:hypothetical protein
MAQQQAMANVTEPMASVSEPMASVTEPMASVTEPMAGGSEPLVINLKQFGLNWTISSDDPVVIPDDFLKLINKVDVERNIFRFRGVNNYNYIRGKFLGGGTYGQVYECIREDDNLPCVIKIVEGVRLYDIIKESLIQILVEKTKNIKNPAINFNGPYAPIFYSIGFNERSGVGYIVTEQMRNTVEKMLEARKGKGMTQDLIAASCITMVQISTMLKDLNKLLRFNHRDFKTDNCMYIRNANGIQLRLIDFGFSYVRLNKLRISCTGIGFKHSSLVTRDLTQFMYELYRNHNGYLPKEIKTPLQDLLTFPVNDTVCKMYKGCPGVQRWRNTYEFLNSETIVNPNGDPAVVRKVFLNVYNNLPYKADLAYAPGMQGLFVAKPAIPIQPPAGKIYNPATGRYVLLDGAIGRLLVNQLDAVNPGDKNGVAAGIGIKACKSPKPNYNPKTRRCVKACPDGRVRNATTFKCAPPTKSCPADKPDYNPKTRRCLKKCPDGKTRNATTFKCA